MIENGTKREIIKRYHQNVSWQNNAENAKERSGKERSDLHDGSYEKYCGI